MRIVICLLAAMLISACVTTGDAPLREASPEEAARTNLRLGSEYLQRGQRERALEKLNRAIEQDPHLAPAHAYLGLVYEQLGKPSQAETHYKTALRIDDDDANVRNMYAVYLCRNERIKEAVKHFLAAATVPTYTTSETAYTNAGLCVLKRSDYEEAETYFRQALQINPRYSDALWQMAKLTNLDDRNFQARAFLQRLANVSEMTAQALWLGVQVERSLGDNRAADNYAVQLRLKYPESVESRLLAESIQNDGSS
ncbi:MAG: type IV pilus biogenesis/stability protein PilW [Gammaproteobacteria bacterium]|nr:type IV pilus biogenesis/stability protein PilW [Gammaproteobacteria bacterium]MDH3768341.1 type IV pilus biogenesis/stability protein PilW [Gammaproteobacteria bacterium]